MGSLRTYKKSIKKESLMYPMDMYNTPWGSLVICCEMFTAFDERKTPKEIKKLWKAFKKDYSKIPTLDDPEFISKTLQWFGLDRPTNWQIAMVHNAKLGHVLFAPYINNQLLPIREDGFKGITLHTGKVYPIDFENKN